MTLNKYTKLQSRQRALSATQPGAKGLVRASVDSDGDIIYISTFDGKVSKNLADILDHVEASGISDFRAFGTAPHGSKAGLNQIAEEAAFLTDRLQNLEQNEKKVLKRLGLDFLIGEKIDVEYRKYQNKDKIDEILRLSTTVDAGVVNISDSGTNVINYKVGQKYLTASQSRQLKYVMGIGTFTDNFISKVLGNDILDNSGPGQLRRLCKSSKKNSRYGIRQAAFSYWTTCTTNC